MQSLSLHGYPLHFDYWNKFCFCVLCSLSFSLSRNGVVDLWEGSKLCQEAQHLIKCSTILLVCFVFILQAQPPPHYTSQSTCLCTINAYIHSKVKVHSVIADPITHTNVMRDTSNWASEASPTLGCSIEISRDIIISESAVALSM